MENKRIKLTVLLLTQGFTQPSKRWVTLKLHSVVTIIAMITGEITTESASTTEEKPDTVHMDPTQENKEELEFLNFLYKTTQLSLTLGSDKKMDPSRPKMLTQVPILHMLTKLSASR